MDNLLFREMRKKPERDLRFTLVLMIGSIFLLVYVVQLMNWNKLKKTETESYALKIQNYSLSLKTEEELKVSPNAAIPWDFTFFFFEKLPINSADKQALMTIKGIGPQLAESILQSRSENGSFKGSADLLKIKGVGPKRAEYFKKIFDFGGE